MRYDDIYLAGVGAHFPKTVPVDEAVASGRYAATLARRTEQQRVTVASDADSQPEMAAHAGRLALTRSGHTADEVGLLLHAVATYNGMDGWNAASYLQDRVLGGNGTAFEIRQLSNGAAASVELAAAYLAATGGAAALITAADRFAEPAWDRWSASPGLVFADGASAVVVSRRRGFARLLSAVSVSDSTLEGLQRGDRPFRPVPDPQDYPVSIRDRAIEFSAVMESREAARRMAVGLRSAGTRAAEEAGVPLGEFDHYVVPNFGKQLLHDECLTPLGIGIERTTWAWGATVGHVGAADQFAGLNHLAESGALTPGRRVMIVSVGGGFNWTCLALEITEAPAWDGLA